MLCDICHVNEATVHLTSQTPGQPDQKRHLCPSCFPVKGTEADKARALFGQFGMNLPEDIEIRDETDAG
jgi:hypothetical protein